jgi:hypothetical protein
MRENKTKTKEETKERKLTEAKIKGENRFKEEYKWTILVLPVVEWRMNE